jgi:hypothetical protein
MSEVARELEGAQDGPKADPDLHVWHTTASLVLPFWPKDDTWRMLNEETERTDVAGGAVAWLISDRGVRPRR